MAMVVVLSYLALLESLSEKLRQALRAKHRKRATYCILNDFLVSTYGAMHYTLPFPKEPSHLIIKYYLARDYYQVHLTLHLSVRAFTAPLGSLPS